MSIRQYDDIAVGPLKRMLERSAIVEIGGCTVGRWPMRCWATRSWALEGLGGLRTEHRRRDDVSGTVHRAEQDGLFLIGPPSGRR